MRPNRFPHIRSTVHLSLQTRAKSSKVIHLPFNDHNGPHSFATFGVTASAPSPGIFSRFFLHSCLFSFFFFFSVYFVFVFFVIFFVCFFLCFAILWVTFRLVDPSVRPFNRHICQLIIFLGSPTPAKMSEWLYTSLPLPSCTRLWLPCIHRGGGNAP